MELTRPTDPIYYFKGENVIMKNLLKARKSGKKGFTLMEMLIVVAIIAILIAIAIPTFGSALTKAKVAADTANLRAYYAEAMANHLLDDTALTKVETATVEKRTKTSVSFPISEKIAALVYGVIS